MRRRQVEPRSNAIQPRIFARIESSAHPSEAFSGRQCEPNGAQGNDQPAPDAEIALRTERPPQRCAPVFQFRFGIVLPLYVGRRIPLRFEPPGDFKRYACA